MVSFLQISALIVLCFQSLMVGGNVIGIDFATDALKVALVKPGTPLEIVTNFQSKRKTPTCLTFYRGERMFGADGYALLARKPELTFTKLYRMLGRTADHPALKELSSQYFPYEIYTNETTKTTALKQEETYYAPEELVAMLLQHVKDMTAAFGAKGIKDCVITIPSFFTQHEREAVYTAAEIVDLNVLSLIEENTAAALNYAIDRSFEEPTSVLFYNMGAGSVQVTIAQFSSYKVKEGGKDKSIGQYEILGKSWDDTVGGFNFDLALADLLARRFNEVWSKKASGKDKDLRDFPRPMTRLRLEANKVKEVLSANNDYPVKTEQLHADVDLVTKVTRADFEEACKDLLDRITLPIDRALAMANLTVKDIKSVELLGGGVRMPKVKKILDEYFKGENAIEVGQHLNGDEAMALGAAFRAANLSTSFKVRKVGASDISSFGVAVRLNTLPVEEKAAAASGSGGLFGSFFKKSEGAAAASEGSVTLDLGDVWTKYTPLYPVKSQLPSKSKSVAFQYDKDILCKIEYDDSAALPAGTSKLLAVYNVTGIAEFAKETAEKGLGQPKIHLSFGLDSSGITQLLKAEATVELPTVTNDAAATADAAANSTEEEAAAAGAAENATDDAAAAGSADKKDAKKDDKKKKDSKKKTEPKKDTVLRRTLTVTVNRHLITPATWSPRMIAESRSRMRLLQEADDLRKANAAAMNDLEGYIYKVKNRLMDDEDKLKAVSTDEQRQEVNDLANAAEEWLYDEGREQPAAVYNAKQNEIKVKAVAIFNRFSELTKRPETVTKARAMLGEVRTTVEGWAEKMPHITESEKEKLLEAVTKAEEWITDKEEQQKDRSPFEAPVFESAEVTTQLKPVSLQLEKLLKKPKPAVEKVKPAANNGTDTNSTDSAEPEVIRVEVIDENNSTTTEGAEKTVEPTPEEGSEKTEEPAAATDSSSDEQKDENEEKKEEEASSPEKEEL